jgi:sec-independent protein translocase protein TatB
MFDISWSEFLLVGVVALVVIGPKELPAVMRTMGQWTRKVRRMASEFQGQFQEAMREAEMTDLKKEVDDMARDVKQSVAQLDPLKEVTGVGEDVKRALAAAPATEAALATTQASAETPPAALEAAAKPEAETPAPPPQAASDQSAREMEALGAGAEATVAQPVDKAKEADPAGRAG